MEYTMYDTLLQLPLFQGLSKAELSEAIEKARFHFQKFGNKEVIFSQGEACNKLAFLLKGKMVAETIAPKGCFSWEEIIDYPTIVEPYSLFGKYQLYKSSYIAQDDVAILTIDKQYIYSVLDKYDVFRINFFNLLCNRIEQQHERTWSIEPRGLEGKLVYFVCNLCSTMRGVKVLRIKMEDLARLLDDTRLNISGVLNKWQEKGYIEMRRKEFVFHDLNALKSIGNE